MATARAEHRFAASSGIFPAPPAPSRASARCVRFPPDLLLSAVPAWRALLTFRRIARRARADARRAETIPLHRPGRRFRKSASPSPPNRILSSQTRDRSAAGNIAPHLSQTHSPPRRSMLSSVRRVCLPFSRPPAHSPLFPTTIPAPFPPLPPPPVPPLP